MRKLIALSCVIAILSVSFTVNASDINSFVEVEKSIEKSDESITENEEPKVEKAEVEDGLLEEADDTERIEDQKDDTEAEIEENSVQESETVTEEIITERSKKTSIKYRAYIQGGEWKNWVSEGQTAGTVGQNKRIEAFCIELEQDNYQGGIEYRAHVQNIGWQQWVTNGELAGTTKQSKQVEAVEIRLTGELSKKYDIYYRVHSAEFGWLDWAKNGETAGSTGWNRAAQAIEIRMIEKGGTAPGKVENSYVQPAFDIEYIQVDETTKVEVNLKALQELVKYNYVDNIELTAEMRYKGAITRNISVEKSLKEILKSGLKVDFHDYGKFNVKVYFKKLGRIVATKNQIVGVSASEYNIAPLSATFPVVLFSLSIWDIKHNENGDVPTIVMLDRPKAYNWNELPEKVYAMPLMARKNMADYTAYQQYVKELYEINPDAKFNLYINDITCSLVHSLIYSNGIPEGQYTIKLLSDGSGSFSTLNDAYKGDNPREKHQQYIEEWNKAKKYAYETGKIADGWGWHAHWNCMYAVLSCEPGTEWWVARNNLFETSDPSFTEEIKQNVSVKNVSKMLSELQSKGDATVNEFKRLYNFNDGYFAEAEAQGKKAMMILGTYVNREKDFEEYARLTSLYYGEDYLYYYKGHPNTPTELWPIKQEQLLKLDMQDVDSSVAAELILFFNPEISLSGYGTSTFNSASKEMACGAFAMSKEEGMSSDSVDYSGIDWFASSIIKGSTDSAITQLCTKDHKYYLMEFSDEILKKGEYDIAIFDADEVVLRFYKEKLNDYTLVKTKRGKSGLAYQSHVTNDGWQNYVSEGEISGTTGEKKALQAVKLELKNIEGGIEYQAHVANIGWQPFVSNGVIAGTVGKNLPMEAIRIKLSGKAEELYDIYYRVHSQDYGWLGWAKNGEPAGTEGYAKRLEAYEVRLVEKNGYAPGTTHESFKSSKISYRTHVQDYGWQKWVKDGNLSGTEGKAKRIEAISIKNLEDKISGDILYRSHIQDYGWEKKWKKNGTISGTEGKAKRLEAIQIKLTGKLAEKYDIYYRVHVQDYGWLDWAKNGAKAGTEGLGKRLEGIEICYVEKEGEAPGFTKRAYVKK